MAKKKKKEMKPWCWYCEREFEDEKVLINHQKIKHFKCNSCNRKLNTVGGLCVHLSQVHKETLTSVPNAIAGRDSVDIEIFGMEGIPPADMEAHIQAWEKNENPNKRARTDDLAPDNLKAQLEAFKQQQQMINGFPPGPPPFAPPMPGMMPGQYPPQPGFPPHQAPYQAPYPPQQPYGLPPRPGPPGPPPQAWGAPAGGYAPYGAPAAPPFGYAPPRPQWPPAPMGGAPQFNGNPYGHGPPIQQTPYTAPPPGTAQSGYGGFQPDQASYQHQGSATSSAPPTTVNANATEASQAAPVHTPAQNDTRHEPVAPPVKTNGPRIVAQEGELSFEELRAQNPKYAFHPED
ncbi:hypothetical protein HK104_007023 [Borealophlyctis nickersoniae]|nr:hypothetical protein HK104_007023 [Borealophlyctis nickersoniae]